MKELEREVTLPEMLEARERRVWHQQELIAQLNRPVISFSMNIAGPVKYSALIHRGFSWGMKQLDAALRASGCAVLQRDIACAVTGCEAMLCVDADAATLKRICCEIEDATALGRLFDMDVIDVDGCKLDRDPILAKPRCCIVCGAPGKGCASRRVHSVEELQAATRAILTEHFRKEDQEQAAILATRALLDEVCTAPKPGLVDRKNNGSHEDMDIFTFTASATALMPYWKECFLLGQESQEKAPEEVFDELRRLGRSAERAMYVVTEGVNTHKGAIFTLGTVCCAAGRCWRADGGWTAEEIAETCAVLSRAAMQADWEAMKKAPVTTVGQKLYLDYGLTGVRGELAEGLPSVIRVALPLMRSLFEKGYGRNEVGAQVLLQLIAAVTDTNMIARGGMEAAETARDSARALLQQGEMADLEQLKQLDETFIQEHLSPGGCADLLAVTFFLRDW